MSLYKAGHDFGLTERKSSPKVIPLPMGRLRVIRRFDMQTKDGLSHREFNTEETEDLTIKIFGGFGLLDGTNLQELPDLPDGSEWSKATKEFAYKDCHLVEEDADPGQDNKWILSQTYETLTDAWANEDVDKASTSDTGLAQLSRIQVAKRNLEGQRIGPRINRRPQHRHDGARRDSMVSARYPFARNTQGRWTAASLSDYNRHDRGRGNRGRR